MSGDSGSGGGWTRFWDVLGNIATVVVLLAVAYLVYIYFFPNGRAVYANLGIHPPVTRDLQFQITRPDLHQPTSLSNEEEPVYREPPPRFREPIRRPYGGMAYGGGYGPAPGPRYGMDQGDGQYRFRIDGEHHRCRPCFNAGEWQDNTCRCHGTAMLVPQ